MYRRVSHMLFPDPVMWIILVALAVITALWSWSTGFTITYGSDFVVFYLAAACFGAGLIYHKRSPGLATFGFSFALFMLMAVVLRPLSYLAVAQQFPLSDPWLADIDRFIGFDWVAHITWVNSHRLALQLLQGAYDSLVIQMLFVFFVFYLTANYERLREFIMLFFGMGIVTTALVMFFPAAGATFAYQPAPEIMSNMASPPGSYSLEHFMALHNGTMKNVIITNSVGLVTFPSFHTQTAILFIWVVRRTVMFWPLFLLNALMIFSTIAIGGHYIIDLVAGAGVFALVAYAYGVWTGRYRLALKNIRVGQVAQTTGFKVQLPLWDYFQQRRAEKASVESAKA